MARKTISKKTRFQIFKRDSFTCQYCGKKSPDVVLEVDHIEPVSKGGDNEITNLITACFDCNRGKSDKRLSDNTAIVLQQQELEQLNERRIQLEMMLEWRKELQGLNDDVVNAVVDEIAEVSGVEVTETGQKKIKKWLKQYDIETILDAVEKSFLQYNEPEKAFNMIPRICYYIANPDKRINQELFYIRGIMRNRFSYLDETKAIAYLIKANETLDTEELKSIVLETANWTRFREKMEEIIGDE